MYITGFSHESKLLKQLVPLSDEREDLMLCEAVDNAPRQGDELAFLVDMEINDREEYHTSVNKESRGHRELIYPSIQFSLQYANEKLPFPALFQWPYFKGWEDSTHGHHRVWQL